MQNYLLISESEELELKYNETIYRVDLKSIFMGRCIFLIYVHEIVIVVFVSFIFTKEIII